MVAGGTPRRVLVVGLAATGEAVARRLRERGCEVVVADDNPTAQLRERAASIDVPLIEAPSGRQIAELASSVELVVVSPGIPIRHPVFATGAPVISELELASRWARAPIVAVTGTNGKTTVATLIGRMLAESGVRCVVAGNIGQPLVDVVDRQADVLVVEASSFQLALTEAFHPRVAIWLNFAENHLDWHPTLAHYAASKQRIWANQSGSDVAIGSEADETVGAALGSAPARRITFGLSRGDYRESEGVLVTPRGETIVAVDQLRRKFPHDRANLLAAAAGALEAGSSLSGCRRAAVEFKGLPHRLELVGEADGVSYVDDSKATTPASVASALEGFASVVLIAGGRSKGTSLSSIRGRAENVRAVVSIGEATADVEHAFSGHRPVVPAGSMREAVRMAADLARPGDVVLLSPGFASFDWYGSYAERGQDFARWVMSDILKRGSAA